MLSISINLTTWSYKSSLLFSYWSFCQLPMHLSALTSLNSSPKPHTSALNPPDTALPSSEVSAHTAPRTTTPFKVWKTPKPLDSTLIFTCCLAEAKTLKPKWTKCTHPSNTPFTDQFGLMLKQTQAQDAHGPDTMPPATVNLWLTWPIKSRQRARTSAYTAQSTCGSQSSEACPHAKVWPPTHCGTLTTMANNPSQTTLNSADGQSPTWNNTLETRHSAAQASIKTMSDWSLVFYQL